MFQILVQILTFLCLSLHILAKDPEKVLELKVNTKGGKLTDLDDLACWNGKGDLGLSTVIIVSE